MTTLITKAILNSLPQQGRVVVNHSANEPNFKPNKMIFQRNNNNNGGFTRGNNSLPVGTPVSVAPSIQAVQQQAQTTRGNVMIPQANHYFESEQDLMAANVFPLAPSITVAVASATGSGAAAIRAYVFNTDLCNATTNNGSGAGSVTYTYQDGFSGLVTSQYLAQARGGMGAVCYGVAVRMVVSSSKAGDPTGLSTSLPRFDIYNMLGSSIPTNFNITTDQTRGDFDSSIEVMACTQNLPRFSQFSLIMPVGDTATLTFNFTPNFKH